MKIWKGSLMQSTTLHTERWCQRITFLLKDMKTTLHLPILVNINYKINFLILQERTQNFKRHFMNLVWIIDMSKILSRLKINKAMT